MRLRRRARRLGALLAALVAVPLLPGTLPASAAPAAAPADDVGTGRRSATISLTELSPAVPDADDETLTVRGTVTNEGTSPIIDSSVAARTGVPLTTRSAIDRAMDRTDFDNALDGGIIRASEQPIGTLAPGMSATFALQVPIEDLRLGEAGAYQVAVGLTGQREDARWTQILGTGRTVVPWQPEPASPDAERTRLSVLWPLVSDTHMTAQTGADEEQTPTFLDDTLLTEISPGGRLDRLVSLGAGLPVTWVIDPDLLASVDAMTDPYQVYEDGRLTEGDGQDEARAWLLDLERAIGQREVVALPFGDPDVASLAHQGMDVPGALGHFADATEVAATTVETVLPGVRASTAYAWPVEGAIDPEIVSAATSAGADRVITRSDSLRPGDSLGHTPGAARPLGGGTTAVVADARLSTLFEEELTGAGAATLAQQELLGQTLAIAGESAEQDRSIVLAPQRVLTGPQAEAMASALTTLRDEADWISFTDLGTAATEEPDPAANREVPSANAYPEGLRAQELPTSAFQAMRETQRTLEDFVVILTEPDRVEAPFGNAIRREMSASWRGRPEEAEDYRSTVQSGLVSLTERVYLIQKTPITLSGRSAVIPVTVQNDLIQDVRNLELRLLSSRQLGLRVSEAQEITIPGGQNMSVRFEADARANGQVTLEAQLFTASNTEPYGERMQFSVQVTSITPTVLVVIACGLLLVVLAGVRMYSQRKRAARAAGADGTAEAEAADARGPATAGEGGSGADTGGGTPGGPSGSERVGPRE
ncbi:DUF6049 family protein [Streptomyces sp. DSM 44917]|uniref:DUF6049 family protein n=1 Tax=Streptomyces boetiae TaxID=3075541 RepID=A0ABU2L666_9ACTN|nr:DUF6049 family protein [Streptomyces sp. DSM 44917]MDT0307049.1 DUF6049 family protein [Streptomyces sp. DSM 44917]